MMELHQLIYFQSVARMGSVTKAAEKMNITQPSVSVAVKKLEAELGVKLLDRNHRKIALTPEGCIFFQRVNVILERLQDAIVEMNDYRTPQRGLLRIGITPILGSLLFPHVFADFQRQNPDIDVKVVEGGSLFIHNQLERGELDLGIMITSNAPSFIDVLPITRGQIFVCLSHKDPLSEYECISLSNLKDHPFILFTEDTYIRKLILEECTKQRFSPKIVFSSTQIDTVLGLVEEGMGIAFFLEEIIRNRIEIVSRPLAESLFLEVGLAWKKKRYQSKAARLFTASVRKTFQSAG